MSSADRQREQVAAGNAESAQPSAGVPLDVWRERVAGWKPRMCIWVQVGELRALLDELELARGGVAPHRPLLKVAVNTMLRFVQRRFTDRPWLLASTFEHGKWTGRYVFCRVPMAKERE